MLALPRAGGIWPPRPWLFQGVVSGLSAVVGYGVGSAISALGARSCAPNRGSDYKRIAWIALAVAAVFGSILLMWLSHRWQNELRALIGIDGEPGFSGLGSTDELVFANVRILLRSSWGRRTKEPIHVAQHAVGIYYRALSESPASLATLAELAFPAASVVLAYFLLDSSLELTQWIGLVLVSALITLLVLATENRAGVKAPPADGVLYDPLVQRVAVLSSPRDG